MSQNLISYRERWSNQTKNIIAQLLWWLEMDNFNRDKLKKKV